MNRWRTGIVTIPRLLFFFFVISYAILACVVLTTERLAKGWPGIAIYAIGCVLVFLAFARKSKSTARGSHGTAGHAPGDQAAPTSPADSVEGAEKIRDRIRTRKSGGRDGRA